MHIKEAVCPRCANVVIVDGGLHDIGTVRLRCTACYQYFLPPDSPRSKTIGEVTNASVEIRIWEPKGSQ
ncbi:MAG TPA: hypothetical protein VHL52_11605 [Acidimicrobiia bacterium]|nr:hypothetical protein [Acidimicrobiia bacterium]